MSDLKFCTNCGARAGDTPFCVSCGHRHEIPATAAEDVCANCGQPTRGLAFCTTCGTPAAPPSAQPATRWESEPVAGANPPIWQATGIDRDEGQRQRRSYGDTSAVAPVRRRRGPIVAVLAVLALGATAIGGWWWLHDNEPTTPTAADQARASDSASSSAASGDPSGTTSSAPAASETATPSEPAGVTCWDDSRVGTAADCATPAGVDGLAWVYPSFSRSDCTPAGHPATKLTVWQCWMETSSGEPVLIRYNEWVSPEAGWQSYEAKGRSASQTIVKSSGGAVIRGVWRFKGVNREGRVTLSSMYRDYPFSVSVEGQSLSAINEGLRDLVQQRDPNEMLTR